DRPAAPSFALLLASRLLVAASAAVIVVVAITLAVAIVAPERRGRAIGLGFAGIVASLVLGVLGTLIGEFWGWRSLFLLLAGVALLGLPLLLGAVVFWCVFNMAPGPAIQNYLLELSPDTAAIQISLNTSALQPAV
ncbi:MFS transporter, partial [Pseudomonas aeruginosa]